MSLNTTASKENVFHVLYSDLDYLQRIVSPRILGFDSIIKSMKPSLDLSVIHIGNEIRWDLLIKAKSMTTTI